MELVQLRGTEHGSALLLLQEFPGGFERGCLAQRERGRHKGQLKGVHGGDQACGERSDGQKWRNEAWLKPEAAEWQWWDKKAQEGTEEKEFGALWAHINFPFSSCSHKLSPSLLVQVLAEES